MTANRGVTRVNQSDLHARSFRLVFDPGPQAGVRPTVQLLEHVLRRALADFPQIFQDDAPVAGFSPRDNGFADAVVRVLDKSGLASRDFLERAKAALRAVGLEARPGLLKAAFFMADALRRVKSIIRCDGDALDAQVNAKTPRWRGDFGRIRRDRDVQIKFAAPEYQVCAARYPSKRGRFISRDCSPVHRAVRASISTVSARS